MENPRHLRAGSTSLDHPSCLPYLKELEGDSELVILLRLIQVGRCPVQDELVFVIERRSTRWDFEMKGRRRECWMERDTNLNRLNKAIRRVLVFLPGLGWYDWSINAELLLPEDSSWVLSAPGELSSSGIPLTNMFLRNEGELANGGRSGMGASNNFSDIGFGLYLTGPWVGW